MLIEKTNTGQAELWIEDDIYYLSHMAGKKGTLESAKQELRIHRELSGGKKLPLFVDMRRIKGVTPEARDYGNSVEVKSIYSAMGILISSILTRTNASMFIRINQPPYPVKIFTEKEEALSWLQQFK